MAALPVEVLRGVYLGILTGIIPALVAWSLGFSFKYFTGVTIPGFAVIVLALAIAGANGGLLVLNDPTVRGSANATVIVVAVVVVLMLSLYAHAKGDAMGASFPKRLSWRGLRDRTIASDVVELVGGFGQVRVTVEGEVGNMEGYPPLPPEVRSAIAEGEWRLPADLTIPELEDRFAERLRTEFDLADVAVNLDERGNATVAAAPPLSGLSKRVPAGHRAVSVDALVPTGLARGDRVRVLTPGATVVGPVVSARSGDGEPSRSRPDEPTDSPDPSASPAPDGGAAEPPAESPSPAVSTTTGGEGRVTVAVPRAEAQPLLRADRARIVVLARGTRREFELVSLLRRAGKRFRKLTVRAGGPLDGTTIGAAAVRERYGVAVLAVRRPDGWAIPARGTTEVAGGDELFAVGTRESLDGFAEVVA